MKRKCDEIAICPARDAKRCDMRCEQPSVASAGYALPPKGPTIEINWTETGTGEYPNLQAFREMHPSARIDAIDGKEAIGHCEGCDKPLFDGDKVLDWLDGPMTCEECSPTPQELKEQEAEFFNEA